ncbi:hypothetical protein AK812_SmicGene44643 [Symbiodinium microadriaticum]|uniref:Uncharacterized protein n=1 Tax=Symbiodinium microadriaticum TaxID=2951 RepID=A0A1Q9BXY2_SYMMI|nr:hypothetical protein AK812_SmicGene44643 [Symbiodinium microadriaticum]
MLKKHLFLQSAVRHMSANTTVVFVDAFDVLLQRPLEELVAAYEQMAKPSLKDVNCWPFPHSGRIRVHRSLPGGGNITWLHRIPRDASLSVRNSIFAVLGALARGALAVSLDSLAGLCDAGQIAQRAEAAAQASTSQPPNLRRRQRRESDVSRSSSKDFRGFISLL